MLLAASSAFLASGAMPKIYEAENTLIVGQSLTASNPNSDQLLAAQRLSQTYATVVTTRPLAQRVIVQLGLGLMEAPLLGGRWSHARQHQQQQPPQALSS